MESMNNMDGALLEYKRAVESLPTATARTIIWKCVLEIVDVGSRPKRILADSGMIQNCSAMEARRIRSNSKQKPQSALAELDKALALCPTYRKPTKIRPCVAKAGRYEDAAKTPK